jgi:hypothetical protein
MPHHHMLLKERHARDSTLCEQDTFPPREASNAWTKNSFHARSALLQQVFTLTTM